MNLRQGMYTARSDSVLIRAPGPQSDEDSCEKLSRQPLIRQLRMSCLNYKIINNLENKKMLITKRSDYAMRICRALQDGKVHNVREICLEENIPKAFAYKILRELEMAELVKSERGNRGGYYLSRPLSELTLYDIVSITEGDMAILHCMKTDCERNPDSMPCKVHKEIERIQNILVSELKKKTIEEILK